jgi:hypothetical protein
MLRYLSHITICLKLHLPDSVTISLQPSLKDMCVMCGDFDTLMIMNNRGAENLSIKLYLASTGAV